MPLTFTLTVLSNSPERIPNASRTWKMPGILLPAPSPWEWEPTSPLSKRPKKSSKTQSSSPTSYHNHLARSHASRKARPRKEKERGRTRPSTTNGTTNRATNHTSQPANTFQYSTTPTPVPNPPYHYGPPPQPPNPFPPSPPKGGQKGHKGKPFQQKGGSKNNNK